MPSGAIRCQRELTAIAAQHMHSQRIDQRSQQRTGLPNPVGQRRTIELNALTRVNLGLAMQRKVVTVFRHQHVRQEPGTRKPAGDRSVRRRRLHDPLARCAAELRSYVPDNL